MNVLTEIIAAANKDRDIAKARIKALEAALRDIMFAFEATENAAEKMYFIASEALAPEQDK